MRKEKGQVLVEMALMLPLLLFLTFGIIDYSYRMFTISILNFAAKAGARAASVTLPPLSPQLGVVLPSSPATGPGKTINANLHNLVPDNSVSYDLQKVDGNGTPIPGAAILAGDSFSVTVKWPNYKMLTPYGKMVELITQGSFTDPPSPYGIAVFRHE
jgi:hypothetical protein